MGGKEKHRMRNVLLPPSRLHPLSPLMRNARAISGLHFLSAEERAGVERARITERRRRFEGSIAVHR